MAEHHEKVIKLPMKHPPTERPTPGWERFGGNEQFMTRLATQIARGTKILSAAALACGEVAQWAAQTKVFLDDALGATHPYELRFEIAILGEERQNIEAALGVLLAVSEDATRGYLKAN